MGRKRIDEMYKKVKVSVAIKKWIYLYFKENETNLSEICDKLLEAYIRDENCI